VKSDLIRRNVVDTLNDIDLSCIRPIGLVNFPGGRPSSTSFRHVTDVEDHDVSSISLGATDPYSIASRSIRIENRSAVRLHDESTG